MQSTRFCMFDLPYTEYSRKSAQAYNCGTTAKSPSRLNFQIEPKNSRKFPFRSHDDQCTGQRTLIQDGHSSKDDVVWPICWPIGDIFRKQLIGVATQEGREGNVKGDRERKYQSLTLMTNHSNHLLKFSSKTLKYPKPVLLQLFHHLSILSIFSLPIHDFCFGRRNSTLYWSLLRQSMVEKPVIHEKRRVFHFNSTATGAFIVFCGHRCDKFFH